MGYTRDWERTDKPMDEDFIEFCNEVIKACEKIGIKIRGWDGEGEPALTLNHISFNGDGENCLDHESFVLDDIVTFGFCKTARKPYDYAVRTILREAYIRGFVTDVSDDGINEEIISDEEYISRNKC